MKNKIAFKIIPTIIILFFSGCVKDSSFSSKNNSEEYDVLPLEKLLLEQEKTEQTEEKTPKKFTKSKDKALLKKLEQSQLDFKVQNLTQKTIYIACFSYQKRYPFTRWTWHKSPIYKIEKNTTITINISIIPDKQDRENVYGYLAVFNSEKEAQNSIYELLNDEQKITLDKIYKLKDQKVVINIEKYGFKGEVLDYDFVPIEKEEVRHKELDFIVENQTGKIIFVTCFIYQIKDDMPVWRYDKTPIKKLNPGQKAIIDVDSIAKNYDRVYVRGSLVVFDEDEEDKIKDATYELLDPKNKINLNRIILLKNKKIVIDVQKYGILGDIIDFEIKPINRINFKNSLKLK